MNVSTKILFCISVNLLFVQLAIGQHTFSTGRFTVGYSFDVDKDETLMNFPVYEHIYIYEFTTNIIKNLYVGLSYTNVNFISNSIRNNYFQYGIVGMYKIEVSKKIYLNSSILLNRADFFTARTYPYNKRKTETYYVGSRNSIEFTPFNKINFLKFELGLCLSHLINKFKDKDSFNYPYIGCTIQLSKSGK